MAVKRFTRILVVMAIVYFQASLMSHLFLQLGTGSDLGNKRKLLKMSHYFMPLDHYPSYEYAYTYLEAGARTLDRELLTQGIEWFKTSLAANPFYYYSHYYMGKAYYFYHFPGIGFFKDTFAAFKKSALLNDHDPDIVADISKIVLSKWPQVQTEDRLLCLGLLKNAIDRVGDSDFKEIIELWSRESKDPEILRVILKDEKELYGKAARILAGAGGSLQLRWELLAGYEQYLFDEVGNQMKGLTFVENAAEVELAALLAKLDRIEGYWRLADGRWVPGTDLYDLRADLMTKRIGAFLANQPKTLSERGRKKLSGLALQFVDRTEDYKNLEALRTMLDQHNYFDVNDMESQYTRLLIEYRQGNHSKVISAIEELKGQAFLTDGRKRREYLDILLLLVDSLEASKLLSVAANTIHEILGLFPGEPSVIWRLLKVQHVIGQKPEEEAMDAALVQKVADSRIFNLKLLSESRQVYFLDKPELSISIGSSLAAKLNMNALLRVFVDGAITREIYRRDLRGEYILTIPGKEYSSAEVRIDFLVFDNSTVL